MRVLLKSGLLILSAETEAERADLSAFTAANRDHVFHLASVSDKGCALQDLGGRAEACAEPINVVFDQVEPRWQPISNLSHTPFDFGGHSYASVEGFWQGLKVEDEAERRRMAGLWGKDAKRAADGQPERPHFSYGGAVHATGGPAHHALMLQVCRAKFTQNASAREALLSTGERPLIHRVRRDSRTIPGALMADIWMRIRAGLRRGAMPEASPPSASEADGRILYFGRDRAAFGFLSHFHPAPIALDGETWPTVEHFYQAQKSFDPAYRAAIRAAATPAEAKQLAAAPDPRRPAAQKSWFLRMGQMPRADWGEVKLDLMRRADRAKFAQHPDLAAQLCATGAAELIEDSPYEPFWGIGPDGAGLNWAGRVLMEIRAELLGRPEGACSV